MRSGQSVNKVGTRSKMCLGRDTPEIHDGLVCSRIQRRAWLRGRRGFTRQPENSKRAHLTPPALQTPPKFTRRPPEKDKKSINGAGEGKKKSAKFWAPPPFRAPTLRAPHLSGLPPFGAPTLRDCETTKTRILAQNGLAQNGLAKNGLSRLNPSSVMKPQRLP